MEYYLARQKNELLILAKIQMNLKGKMWDERNQTQKATYCVILLLPPSGKGKPNGQRAVLLVFATGRWRRRDGWKRSI